MTLKYGVYCMWAGDMMNTSLKADGMVNSLDMFVVQTQYGNNSVLRGTYMISDMNMDGAANAMDIFLVQANFARGLRNPLSYFYEN
jgi:hypothetical protein